MKKIVVTVHDVTPMFSHELEVIFAALDRLGARVRTDLVVADYHHRFKISDDRTFVERLANEKAHGAELSLHGVYHDFAEFLRLDYKQASVRLDQGVDIFTEALGFAPSGFVAPQWLQSNGSLRAVGDHNFFYTATLTGIQYRNGWRPCCFPLNYDWGGIGLDRLMTRWNGLVCRCRRSGFIRFDLHPMDIPDGLWSGALDQLQYLIEHGWQPVTCEQLGREAGTTQSEDK